MSVVGSLAVQLFISAGFAGLAMAAGNGRSRRRAERREADGLLRSAEAALDDHAAWDARATAVLKLQEAEIKAVAARSLPKRSGRIARPLTDPGMLAGLYAGTACFAAVTMVLWRRIEKRNR